MDVPTSQLHRLACAASTADILVEIAEERRRQIDVEGWTPAHDDEHRNGVLAQAAACYADPAPLSQKVGGFAFLVPVRWPWNANWWKPKSRRRDLVRAAALIVAEIERLDRRSAERNAPGQQDLLGGAEAAS